MSGNTWNTRHRLEKATKTRVVKWIPVHPLLAEMLTAWKRRGCAELLGRPPEPEDLIVPALRGEARNNSYSWRLWAQDLEALGLGHQRHYETRSTFLNLARAGGAVPEDLDKITHPSPRKARDLYDRTGILWPLLCRAVLCVKVSPSARPAEGDAAGLRAVAASPADGYRSTGTPSDEGAGWAEKPSVRRSFGARRNGGRAGESNPPTAPLSTIHRF